MYDVLILGSGAAGMTAALYCVRASLKTAVIEKFPVSGGQMNLTDAIDNYPGIENAEGYQISTAMREQAENAGAEFICATAEKIEKSDRITVFTDEGEYSCKALIYAAGAVHRQLEVTGEREFSGRGVSYCAVCDGGFYRNKVTAVVGGGDTALKEALYLAGGCSKVYLIHRREEFRGNVSLVNKCRENDKIEIITSAVVTEIFGDGMVKGVKLDCNGSEREISCDGVFAAVGMLPETDILKGICELDSNGYIKAGEDCVTSAEGIYAAGDVRTKPLRQIITACADGANAANSAEHFIRMK